MSAQTAQASTQDAKQDGTSARQAKSQEKLERGVQLITALLKGGDWVPSAEIHKKLKDELSEGMFGRVKAHLGIEHRRVRGPNGKAQYEWRLPQKAAGKAGASK